MKYKTGDKVIAEWTGPTKGKFEAEITGVYGAGFYTIKILTPGYEYIDAWHEAGLRLKKEAEDGR